MSPYRTALVCWRCGRSRPVPKIASRIRHWFCHRTVNGARCGTFNVGED